MMFLLEGVDTYKIHEPLFEGTRVILSYLNEDYTPAYIQGISGAAFRIGGICPCAPTCTYAMQPVELLKILGYKAKHFNLCSEGKSINTHWDEMISNIKKELLDNRPVLVWNAFSFGEWDVVCGFDDSEEVFLGRGSNTDIGRYSKSKYKHTKELNDIPAFGAIFIGEKIFNLNKENAEISALKEAVKHAYTKEKGGKLNIKCKGWDFYEGIQCYQRWSDAFKTTIDKKRTAGDTYCYNVYSSTHKTASEFLREIAPNYSNAKHYLLKASDCFYNEVDILLQGKSMIDCDSGEEYDKLRNKNLSEIINKACDEYAKGIDWIKKAIEFMC